MSKTLPPPPPPRRILSPSVSIGVLILVRPVPVANTQGLEELTTRFILGRPASSYGDLVMSIGMDEGRQWFTVMVGTQVISVPASNVTSYRLVAL
jgi:hypothetical protein